MQPFKWYVNRLRGMSPGEILWRARSELNNNIDRVRIPLGFYPGTQKFTFDHNGWSPGFSVTDVKTGEWASSNKKEEIDWCMRLVEQADMIAANRLTFFNLENTHFGDPVDWHLDAQSGKRSPLCHSQSIDYRDFNVTGDCKLVWEPNRHHQLVVLGRAYKATGEIKYAKAVIEQFESWLSACPFGKGMNWRSPLELGIRLINWVWAIDLIQDSGLFSGKIRSTILHSVYLHLWEITRKFSQGSSANNHLVGEAAGVFIATSYFNTFNESRHWQKKSKEILLREIFAQTYSDGCTREQALGYHLFVLQFYLVSGIAARKTNRDFPETYWNRVKKMMEFLGCIYEGGGSLPMFGDRDDGYVLDLGNMNDDPRGFFSTGAVLFEHSDFKSWAGSYQESSRWLLNSSSETGFNSLTASTGKPIESQEFKNSGYYLLQCGSPEKNEHVSVLFDCGELGYQSIAAHGHADALSFSLRAYGLDIFVDPGTYDYFTYPNWREYFRSTRAHNTITVDNQDQSVMQGPFMWGNHANASCTHFSRNKNGGTVSGEHDGYTRLNDPVTHRRKLDLNKESRQLTIEDELICKGSHRVTIYFHLSDSCMVSKQSGNLLKINAGNKIFTLKLDPNLSVTVLNGSENPISGWISSGYHRKTRSPTLVCDIMINGTTAFSSLLSF